MSYSEPKRRIRNGVPSAHYWVRWNDGGRRTWRSTGQETLKLAKETLATWRMREAKGERHVEDIDLATASERWLKAKEDTVSHVCHIVYKTHRKHWLRILGAKGNLKSITREDIRRFLRKRKSEGKSPRTLANHRSVLWTFFDWSRIEGLIAQNPVEGVDSVRLEKRRPRALDEVEEVRFLDECRAVGGNVHGFLLTAFRSGLRRGAISRMEWNHIDWSRGEWTIPARIMKSREDFTGRPIEPELLDWLRANRRPAGPVFGLLDVEKFRAARARAALDGFKVHDARRTFASRMRRRGVALEAVMWLGDWRDIKVLLEIYREVRPEEGQEAMRKAFGAPAVEAPREEGQR